MLSNPFWLQLQELIFLFPSVNRRDKPIKISSPPLAIKLPSQPKKNSEISILRDWGRGRGGGRVSSFSTISPAKERFDGVGESV